MGARSFGLHLGLPALAMFALALACGETRSPIGDECLRNDDCLSGVCSSRSCVSAPPLVSGANGPPPDEEPLIPSADGATDVRDAGSDG